MVMWRNECQWCTKQSTIDRSQGTVGLEEAINIGKSETRKGVEKMDSFSLIDQHGALWIME